MEYFVNLCVSLHKGYVDLCALLIFNMCAAEGSTLGTILIKGPSLGTNRVLIQCLPEHARYASREGSCVPGLHLLLSPNGPPFQCSFSLLIGPSFRF